MHQVIEQTKEEKIETYMKLSKRELITLLMENQHHIQPMYSVETVHPDPNGTTTYASAGGWYEPFISS